MQSDVSVAGSQFSIQASPSLADIARSVASTIPHPTDPNRTLWDMRDDRGPFSGPIALAIQKLFEEPLAVGSGTGIGALGSGSDYTVRYTTFCLADSLIPSDLGILTALRRK